MFPNKPIRKP